MEDNDASEANAREGMILPHNQSLGWTSEELGIHVDTL